MPKYSIIVPVYNVVDYLEECVCSVLTQSYIDFELILINDGSTDGCGNMCDKFAQTDNRIIVIHQENKGLSAARNVGIDRAGGEYLVFLDSDDFWENADVLKVINNRICENKAEVLSFNYVKYDQGEKSSPYFRNTMSMPCGISNTLKYQIDNNVWIACAWNKVIHRRLFEKRDMFFVEGITAEDIDWCLRLALNATSFDYICDVLVCYRVRENSISKNVTIPKVNTLLNNIDTCKLLLQRCNDENKVELLNSYVGFQYSTVLFRLAILEKDPNWRVLFERTDKERYLLSYSKNPKVRLLHVVTSIGGLQLTLFLLRLFINRNG